MTAGSLRRAPARAQAAAFSSAAARYWLLVHPLACEQLRRFSVRASAICDGELRAVALAALAKRSNVEGAVVFASFVAPAQRARVVRASAAFQAAYDYLDVLTERPHPDAVRHSLSSHAALLDALDAGAASELGSGGAARERVEVGGARVRVPDDGGYLAAMLDVCGEALAGLPSYARAQPHALRAAERVVRFQGLNCGREQGDERELARWAGSLGEPDCGLAWWELAAAAGSSLGVLATIAAAAAPALETETLDALELAYHPSIGALHSLLDQLADVEEDEASGQLNLIGNYDDAGGADGGRALARAFGLIAARARASAQGLADAGAGSHHTIVLAAMAASYLSLPQTSTSRALGARTAVLAALGPLASASLAVFEGRRLAGAL
ncbi:MAG: DUF2600 family protein [Solirubrobacteraceae bacterium]